MIVQERKIVFINQVGANYFGASSVEELIGNMLRNSAIKTLLNLPKSDKINSNKMRF